jgi:hypothetical protein
VVQAEYITSLVRDRALATRAFSGTSFSPEKRGQSRREGYAEAVNGFYAELWPLAQTDDQKALLATEMERYRQGMISMTNAYLHSHSNVVSTMIAGGSNFPVRRQQKLGQRADNKLNGLLEWNERARAAVKRTLLDARPDEVKADHAWRVIERDLKSSLVCELAQAQYDVLKRKVGSPDQGFGRHHRTFL